MNKKHINSQLGKKFNEFVKSIKDIKVRELVEKGTIITGGAIVSLLQSEKPNDYDLYFKDFKTCYKVAEYYIDEFNKEHKSKIAELKIQSAGEKKEWIGYDKAIKETAKGEEPRIKVFIRSEGIAGECEDDVEESMQTNIEPDSNLSSMESEEKYIPKFLTSNAISLSGKIQIVIRFYGEPNEIHENYDFVHCTNFWTAWDRKVVLKLEALEAIINKQLIYVGSKYPLCSIIRTRKFINRGWTINAGQYLKMCMQLNELNLKDIKTLEDQLVGVDSGYFMMLINALDKKKNSDTDFELNSSYVASIVDKIF